MTAFLCTLPLVSGLFAACSAPGPFATGYVEGEYVLIAPVETAQIETLRVRRGDRVEAGIPVAEMERRDAEIALSVATATYEQTLYELADLKTGKRPEEIRVIEATLASARAQSDEAARAAVRMTNLAARGAATETQRDDAVTAAEVAKAKVAELEAGLAVARLPSRPEAIAAKEASLERAMSERRRAEWTLENRTLTAPAAGIVYDIIRKAGEIAGPGAPVLSFLPDGAVKLRLYVPEGSVSAIRTGSRLAVGCDGCAGGLQAVVTYVSDAPEFTPPVIYSLDNRQKLVYLVEARPDPAESLKPGQIVDVRLDGAAP